MDQINEIKQKLDIVDVVGSFVTLKKSGRNYKGICPFHGEDTPSFMVSQELQIFKCFGCNEAGDIFKFIQKIEGVEFGQALQILADRAGIELEKHTYDSQKDSLKKKLYEINHLTAELYHYLLTKHPAGKEALKYVKEKRRLSDKTIKDFKVGYAPMAWDTVLNALTKKKYTPEELYAAGVVVQRSGGGYYDKFRGRIAFPLTGIDGKIVAFTARTIFDAEPKYLNTNETAVFQKSSLVFGLDKGKVSIKKEGAVFVEGQMDVISAHQAGITNVVASSGTSLTVTQLNVIFRYTKDIIFCFDSDSAGQGASRRAIELAEREGFNIKVAVIPNEYKDLDEIIQKDPLEAKEVIAAAVPAYDFILYSILNKYDKNTAIGKKKIMEELGSDFSRITNKVVQDHYAKKIAEELDVEQNIIAELLSNKVSAKNVRFDDSPQKALEPVKLEKRSIEELMIALLLKWPHSETELEPLDSLKTLMYKLEPQDFINSQLRQIFTSLRTYFENNGFYSKKEFEIQSFVVTIDDSLKELVIELYLWDLGIISEEPKLFLLEIHATFARIKKDAIKRELKNLTAQIKQAEAQGDSKRLKELTKKFTEYSQELQEVYAEKS